MTATHRGPHFLHFPHYPHPRSPHKPRCKVQKVQEMQPPMDRKIIGEIHDNEWKDVSEKLTDFLTPCCQKWKMCLQNLPKMDILYGNYLYLRDFKQNSTEN